MAHPGYTPTDRRPVSARDWRVSERMARSLADNGVNPNAISLSGVVFCALAGELFLATRYLETPLAIRLVWLLGALLILLRGMANVLDGMVAIQSGKASARGELFNDVPDRFSDAFILVGFGYAIHSSPLLGWTAALLAVLTAYVRVLGKACGTPSDFRGPMAKTHRMYLLVAAAIYFTLTPAAWHRIGDFGLPAFVLLLIVFGCLVTIIRRLAFISRALDRRP